MAFRLLSAEFELDKTYEVRGHYISYKLLTDLKLISFRFLTNATKKNQDLKSLWNGSVEVERTPGGKFMSKIRFVLRLLDPHLPADVVIVRPWVQWNKALILAKKLWGRPYVVWLDTYRYDRQQKLRDILYHEFRYGLLLRNADLIIGEAPACAQVAAQRIPGVRVIHIPIGLDLDPIRKIEKRWDEENSRPVRSNIVLYVGRISPEKRPHWSVDAFNQLAAQFPDWRLRVVGPVTSPGGVSNQKYLAQLQNSIEQSSYKDRIEFIPGLYGEDLYRQYCEASIVVLPSTMEGVPTTVIEAMYFGAVMLATESGEVRWQLNDGKAGVVLEKHDWEGFLAAMRKLMSNHDERERLSRAGHQRVLDNFNWEKNLPVEAEELEGVYLRSRSHLRSKRSHLNRRV